MIIKKRGTAQMWWIIVGAIIALLVLVFIVVWVRSSGSKAFGAVDDNIAGLGDCDDDGISDFFDKCPCDPQIGDTLEEGQQCSPRVIASCPDKCS
jgi:hypothetical protein